MWWPARPVPNKKVATLNAPNAVNVERKAGVLALGALGGPKRKKS